MTRLGKGLGDHAHKMLAKKGTYQSYHHTIINTMYMFFDS